MKTVTSANDGAAASGTAPTATETVAPTGVSTDAPVGVVAPSPTASPEPEPAAAPTASPEPEPAAAPARPAASEPEPSAAATAEEVEDQTPFWMPWHPHWPIFPARTPRHPPPRRPAFGLFALVVLGLVAAFIAWVSAEPLWLAIGHGDQGTATATHCSIEGSPYECVVFTATGGRYVAEDVTLLGTEHGHLRQGTWVAAEMVSAHSSRAYAVDATGLRLRSAAGLVALLLCGLGIAWATGANRLEPPAVRRAAFLACLGAPLLLALGFLAATF
jgi:hypothetical protein